MLNATPSRDLKHVGLDVQVGIATEKGKRERNEDFLAAHLGTPGERATRGVLAAVADGVGGARGGREAAEITVRGLIDGYFGQAATLSVETAVARATEAVNRWIVAQGRTSAGLSGMATTLSALVLIGRKAHVFHVGDSRVYRLANGRLEQLTEDHVHNHPDLSHILYRAIGIEDNVRLDHLAIRVEPYDRFLLCTDGIHGAMSEDAIRAALADNSTAEEVASDLVHAALSAGTHDNASALVIDVNVVPPLDLTGAEAEIDHLALAELPKPGETIDEFRIASVLSDGRYCQLFRAIDQLNGRTVVLKFPRPHTASEKTFRAAFAREILIGGQPRSPSVGEVFLAPRGRQTRLYLVMPHYEGETLEARIRRPPQLTLAEGLKIGVELARAIASLHRSGVIHRDVKAENVILLKNGGIKLLDFGVARIEKFDQQQQIDDGPVPGTATYMAPEMRRGSVGDERTDLYALGNLLYYTFTRHFPYGEIEPFSNPRLKAPVPVSRYRPDLPAWLDFVLKKSFAPDPDERHGDVLEFAFELENGYARGELAIRQRVPIYDRNPLLCWQLSSVALLILLLASWAIR